MAIRAKAKPRLQLAAVIIAFAGIFGCFSSGTSMPREYGARASAVRFYVSSADLPMLRGVKVYLMTGAGESLIGETDALGAIAIDRHRLQDGGSLAVLFCKEGFFCGAYRVKQDEFLEYDEHFIALAPFAVR